MNQKTAQILSTIIIAAFVVTDIFTWRDIFAGHFGSGAGAGHFAAAPTDVAQDYFLDVGQGDSELIIFPGDIKVMTDAGPTDEVLASLAKVLSPDDDYIDVAIISHPQLDHFNGYNFILDHYRVGAFIYNGRDDDPGVKEWPELKEKIRAKNIPLITLGVGDKILIGGGNGATTATTTLDEIDMLSPDLVFAQSAELNDTGFVEFVKTPQFTTLLTADIGFNVEDWLLVEGDNIHVDVLKVPHHGSKYSSGDAFLRAVNPRVAVVEVGAHNSYGHPGSSTLARLASDTAAKIYRTDQDGTVAVWPNGDGKLTVEQSKN